MTWPLAIRWTPWLAWLGWLLDTSMGPPGPRGHFPTYLTLAFHGSNALMGLAFLAVPMIVMTGYGRRRGGISTGVIVAANALSISMAASRFARVLEMYGPPYRLTTTLDCVAAVAITYCTWRLYPTLESILKLPSRKDLHDANDRLNAEVIKGVLREHELAAMVDLLERKIRIAALEVARLEHDRQSADWWRTQRDELADIRDRFREIARTAEAE